MSDTHHRWLVIGSNSFSGAHFVDHLLEKGQEVCGASRSPELHHAFLPYASRTGGKFKFHCLDLNRDLEALMDVTCEFKPDYVVNFAAQSMVAQSWAHPEHWYRTNVVAQVLFHDRLRTCRFLRKYVHISTPEVYGSCTGMIDEHAPYNPSTPYAVSRAACDMHLKSFLQAYQFPVIWTRAANVFGPCQQLYRIIPKTIYCILKGEKLKLEGGGQSIRSFIHIQDVAEGTRLAALQAKPGAIYHFSTPEHHSIREVVEEVCRQMDVTFEKVVEVTGDRLGKDAAYTLDSTRARNELNWKPRLTFSEGVHQTVTWMKEHWHAIREMPAVYQHKE